VIYIEETVRGAIMHMHLYVHVVFFHVCFYAKVILKRFLILPIVEQRMKNISICSTRFACSISSFCDVPVILLNANLVFPSFPHEY
jgi:hypothetical protein